MSKAVDALHPPARAGRADGAPRWIARLLPAIGLAMLLVVTGCLLGNAAQVVRAGLAAIAYPFELDFAEGLVLAPVRALSTGGAIYPPARDAPALISNYPPVYYAAAAALGSAVGDHLAAGRALSLASAVLAALVLSALAWRAIEPAAGWLVRGLAAAAAGLGFLQISYTAAWAALMRVDLLAVLFAFTGVWVFGATAARGQRVYWCLVPFLFAAYTKQTTVAAVAACVVTAARASLRRGVTLAFVFAAAVLCTGAALQIGTSGGFAFHVITADQNPYSAERAAAFLQDIAIRYPVLVALAIALAPALLASLPRGRDAEPSPRSAARGWTRAALGAYLPLVALTSLTVGTIGSEVNHLIELMGVVVAGAAVAVGDALRPLASNPLDPTRSNGAAIAAIVVPALLLWQVVRLAPPSTVESVEVPGPAQQAHTAALLDLVRHVDGPVLSEDQTLLTLAGQPIVFQPFNITQLMYRQARDEAPLVDALERGEFPLVVLRFDVRSPTPLALSRFTPAMIGAVREHYLPLPAFPGYWLYAPRHRMEAARP